MAPRVGPRGATIADVLRVAQGGPSQPPTPINRGGYKITRLSSGQPDATALRDTLMGMIFTGPASTYGKKYGGFPTAEMGKLAITGGIEPYYQVGQAAQSYAAENAQKLNEQALSDISRAYGLVGPTKLTLKVDPVTGRVVPFDVQPTADYVPGQPGGRPVSAADYYWNAPIDRATQSANAAVEDAKTALAAAKARMNIDARRQAIAQLGDIEQRAAVQQPGFYQNLTNEADRELAREIRRGLGVGADTAASYNDQLIAQQNAAEQDLRAARYAKSMAEMNRIQSPGLQQTGIVRRTEEQIANDPYAQLASDIAATPRYELARKMAVERYGYSPDVAQAMFTPEMDVQANQERRAYEKDLMYQAYNIDPTYDTEDIILSTSGPEALMAYREQQAQAAINRANEGARTAEEVAYDQQIEAMVGINPADVAVGDVATARQIMSNPEWQNQLVMNIQAISNADATTAEDKKNLARQFASDYYKNQISAGVNPVVAGVAAQTMLESIVRFDFLNAYGG